MERVVKLIRLFTILLFFIILMTTYAYLPSRVGLMTDDLGTTTFWVTRSMFFYVVLGFALVMILATRLSADYIRKSPASENHPFLNKVIKDKLANWIGILGAVVNVFLCLGIAFVGLFNNANSVNISSWGYLIYFGQFLLLAWLAGFIWLLVRARKTV